MEEGAVGTILVSLVLRYDVVVVKIACVVQFILTGHIKLLRIMVFVSNRKAEFGSH